MRHKYTIVTLLTITFVAPMLAAWLAYANGLFLTGKHVHHGVLLVPSVLITSLQLKDRHDQPVNKQLQGKWWLIYLTSSPRNSLSLRNLYYMKQVRQATGKDRERIGRAIITTDSKDDAWLNKHYPDTQHFLISVTKVPLLAPSPEKLDLLQGSLYLLDPLGNIMMSYAPNAAPKGILKDLERVLKVSQIG